MSFHEKTLHCADCGTDFSFTAEEQEFLQSKGYTNEPKRCPSCRQARKTEQHGSRGNNYGLRRRMFPATQAGHGQDAEVPFALTDARLAYYSAYFSKVRLSN